MSRHLFSCAAWPDRHINTYADLYDWLEYIQEKLHLDFDRTCGFDVYHWMSDEDREDGNRLLAEALDLLLLDCRWPEELDMYLDGHLSFDVLRSYLRPDGWPKSYDETRAEELLEMRSNIAAAKSRRRAEREKEAEKEGDKRGPADNIKQQ